MMLDSVFCMANATAAVSTVVVVRIEAMSSLKMNRSAAMPNTTYTRVDVRSRL